MADRLPRGSSGSKSFLEKIPRTIIISSPFIIFAKNPTVTMKFIASLALLAGQAAAFSPSITTPQQALSATRLEARKPFISGNWKLNPSTKDEALALGKDIAASITADSPDVDVALFVPYVFIESTMGVVGDKLSIGAEGVCPELKGAYTGAISTSMLKSIGVQWALAGHSERRVIYGETDDYINAQCLKLVEQGMSVMLCIGESLAEFEQDLAASVCAVQLKKGLKGISAKDMSQVAIAYEPVWAIGTGKGKFICVEMLRFYLC